MIAIFFGPPGVGKSTLYACIAQLNKRKKEAYYERISKSKLYASFFLLLSCAIIAYNVDLPTPGGPKNIAIIFHHHLYNHLLIPKTY